jgi:hypothetical protein
VDGAGEGSHPNFFSPQMFEQHMRVAWSPAREVEFQHLEDNLFTVQSFCLGDWLKMEEGGPWLFRQSDVCIEKYGFKFARFQWDTGKKPSSPI